MLKEKALEVIENFPSEFELDSLLERLVFIQNVEEGLAQIESGETMTNEELKEDIKTW